MFPEKHVLGVMEGHHADAIDIKKATIDCLRNPINSEPLQEVVKKVKRIISFVASDVTRLWSKIGKF